MDGIHDVAAFEGHVFDVDAGESVGFFGGAEGDGFYCDGFTGLTDLQFDGPEGALDAEADFDVGVFVIAETGGVLDGG